MSLNAEGNYIFVGSNDKIAFYEYIDSDTENTVEQKFEIANFKHSNITNILHINRNNRQELITTEKNLVCIWSHGSIHPEYIMTYHDKDISSVYYIEETRILFTACKDQSIKVI
jgi:WD40 repeat protein